jgi:hypothetical protein
MISGFLRRALLKGLLKKLVEIEIINLRDFAIDDYGRLTIGLMEEERE